MADNCVIPAEAPGEGAPSLVSILRWRATQQPDRWAYSFLPDGETENCRWTYADLDRKARSIAVELARVAKPGDRALLLYPASLEFLAAFMGCLYSGVIAVPLFAPRPNKGLSRLQTILADCGAKLALTASQSLADRAAWEELAQATGMQLLSTQDLDPAQADCWSSREIHRDDLAFLQYTSGSTSAPRGVMATHGNLVYNCAYMRESLELSSQTMAVSWLPHFHDMGLIDGLLNPLFNGYPTVIIPPAQFVQRPLCWLQAITKYRATHSGGPNFAYDLCVDKIKPAEREGLDLSRLKMAYCGAEPVRRETLDRFADYFAPCGFQSQVHYPCYGLAEATLMVCGGYRDQPPIHQHINAAALEQHRIVPSGEDDPERRTLVGCGHARRQTRMLIVDPQTLEALPDDAVGEIWVGGPTVASGYWQRPQESQATFDARLIGREHEGPFLRTGDLGYLSDGELFITGRLKDLIIIHGANLYPQDLEWVADRVHPALKPGFSAAFSVERDGEERLVMAHEIDRQHRKLSAEEFESVAAAVRRAIAEQFELAVFSVALFNVGAINRTSSGKIQRQACRADYLSGAADLLWESRLMDRPAVASVATVVPTYDELRSQRPTDRRRTLETYLRQRVGDSLSLAWRSIDPRAPLGSLGVDSLKGAELAAQLQSDLDLKLSQTLIWNYPTIAALAGHLVETLGLGADCDTSPGAPRVNGQIDPVPFASCSAEAR